jgi:NADP-dependent 3-hydroxy acid dehydrogenase YdfG
MATSLKDRVALITGASSGIGEGIALGLAAEGVKVFATGRRADRLATLKSQIEAAGSEAEVVAGDVTDEAFAKGLVHKTVERFGRLDILVNSAGIMYFGNVEDARVDEWKHSMDLNLFATLYTCSAAIPVMKAQGEGDIINISSTAGRRWMGGPYGASKIALNSFHEGLRSEVSLSNIRCCIIEPGATTSEIWDKNPDPKMREYLKNHVEKEGAMKPEDISDSVVLVLKLPRRANLCEILIRPTIDVNPGVGG